MELMASSGDGKIFPPGFRFHPTDEELVLFYLKRKICGKSYGLDVIAETDVYKWDPEELPEISKLKTGDRQWFFFGPRDQKYPHRARSNRATRHGYWKATGKDRTITCRSRSVGNKKTLVFYRGRAPGGERTNWVMHEYVLDEEELKRCPAPLNYFALYKAFKKSGIGPKNGEHYGAIFREEDWEEDHLDAQCFNKPENPMTQANESLPSDNVIAHHCETNLLLEDLEEVMKQIAEEPLAVQSSTVDYGYAADQFNGLKVAHDALIENCLRDVPLPPILPYGQQTLVQASFNDQESGFSQSLTHEAPEVTSVSDSNRHYHLVADEDFPEDFLEMNDLVGPEQTRKTLDESWSDLENLEFDRLAEFDLFQDASPFVSEVGVSESAAISQLHMTSFEDGFVNPSSSSYSIDDNAAVTHQPQPLSNNSNVVVPQWWTDEQKGSVFSSTESTLGSIPSSTTGVVYRYQNNGFDQHSLGADENGSRKQEGLTDSWLSTALWSFVESIPTTPASASDSALVSRAFGRVSSLSRKRLNVGNLNTVAANASATPRISGRSVGGFICFSLLGVLCAVLWLMVATSVRVMG